MPARAPRISIGGSVYRADACRPLAEAAARGDLALGAFARGQYPGRRLPPGALPGLLSAGFWDAHKDQSWGLAEHRNEGVELTFLETGGLAYRAGGRRFHLRPGDLTITRPWQPHAVGAPHVTAGRLHFLILDLGVRQPHQRWSWPPWLALTREDLRALATLLRENDGTVWRAVPEVGASFAAIARLAGGGAPPGACSSRLALLVGELLLGVLEMLKGRAAPRNADLATGGHSVTLFLERLPEHLAEPWTLDAMAEQCGMKRTRFAHYCKRLTNRTPAEHLAHLRVEKARRLLRERRGATVTEIALECGFSSGQYFATAFRRHTGMAPRRARAGAGG